MPSNKDKGHVLQVRLTDDEWAQVQKMAKGTTVTAVVKRWVAGDEANPATRLRGGDAGKGNPLPDNPEIRPSEPVVEQVEMTGPEDEHFRKDGRIVRDWHIKR